LVPRPALPDGTVGVAANPVWINSYQAKNPAVPFGGYKVSGYGRDPVSGKWKST
jgi:acyl-CoA reductase-like NAD-dependent aldehyde dehydrogenase